MQSIQMTPVGIVRTTHEDDGQWAGVHSEIHIHEAYRDGLNGLADWSHIVVIFVMHETTFDPQTQLVTNPEDRADLPSVGVFAQRGRARPNTIGSTAVRLISVEDHIITVKGLDAIDGTPVLDIKPYAPIYDGATQPMVPSWFVRLMQGVG